jgi:hypothetical protein
MCVHFVERREGLRRVFCTSHMTCELERTDFEHIQIHNQINHLATIFLLQVDHATLDAAYPPKPFGINHLGVEVYVTLRQNV